MHKKILLVVSLLEGKNFSSRSDKLVIQVSFGGECLSTDPVEANDKPVFDAELAWELDKQGLHLHRLQRSPLKLQCFLCDRQGRTLENLGYLILDIRNSKENQAEHTWYRLLNTKADGPKPEILISLYLEYGSKKEAGHTSENVSPDDRPQVLSVPKAKGTFTSEYLKPKLNSQEGFYQIGPEDLCVDFFSLSITLVFAENLTRIVDSGQMESNYSFQYSLLGNNVVTEKFRDLSKADFPAERAAVRIRSSLNALRGFLKKQPNVHIFLHADDVPIAETNVSLESLVADDGEMKVEGVFCMLPIGMSSSRGSAGVGVSVVLKRENGSPSNSHNSENCASRKDATNCSKNSSASINSSRKKSGSVGSHVSLPDSVDAIPTFWNEDHTSKPKSIDDKPQDSRHESVSVEERQRPTKETSRKEADTSPRHFHFILDLKTLKMELELEAFTCFLRYSYPFFGTPAPISTHPGILVSPFVDVHLPHGYCSFDFVTDLRNLLNTFENIPLFVEVLEKLPDFPEGRLVGMVKICLHPVLESPSTRFVGPDGRMVEKRSVPSILPVVSPNGTSWGTLKVVMGLDDLGSVEVEKLFSYGHPSEGEVPKQQEMTSLVLELELWKERQEVLFREQLRLKEQEHLRTLTTEWKERDVERELLVQTKLRECREQEERLKRALEDVDFREKQLSRREAALNASKAGLELQAKRAQEEAQESVRRVRSDCEHRLAMEQERLQRVQEERDRLLDKEKASRGSDEVRLRSELEISNLEKAELRRKLDAVTLAKNRYKEQWSKALARISALQHKLHPREEQSSLEGEKRALARIKEEVEALKRRMHDAPRVENDYVTQLREERDMLLSTGVYSESDRIVQELEKHIANASSTLNN